MKLIKNKNGDFKIEEINFRRSYIEQLTKFFQSGIFDIYVPIEVDDEEKIVRTSININQKQLDEYIERLNKEFEVEFYEVFPENMNGKPKIVELKLNKEKQKLIRLVAVKSDKKFSKSKEELFLDFSKYNIFISPYARLRSLYGLPLRAYLQGGHRKKVIKL